MKTRVLMLTASIGGGHLTTTEALAGYLQEQIPDAEIETRDYMRYLTSFERGMIEVPYAFSIKRFPQFYRQLYHSMKKLVVARTVSDSLEAMGAKHMHKDFSLHHPNIVINSAPLTVNLCSVMRSTYQHQFFNVVTTTDLLTHVGWISPEVDLYTVANDEAKAQMVSWGVEAHKIHVVGVPINPQVAELPSKEVLRERLGLDPHLPTILLSVGALGVYRGYKGLVKVLRELRIPCQLILINAKKAFPLNNNPNIKVVRLGFTPLFTSYLKAADVVLGKAGGLTMAEAAAVGTPALIFEPIPGHEEDNASYLVRHEAAIWAQSKDELAEALENILLNATLRQNMSYNMLKLGKPEAAKHACELILAGWQNKMR